MTGLRRSIPRGGDCWWRSTVLSPGPRRKAKPDGPASAVPCRRHEPIASIEAANKHRACAMHDRTTEGGADIPNVRQCILPRRNITTPTDYKHIEGGKRCPGMK